LQLNPVLSLLAEEGLTEEMMAILREISSLSASAKNRQFAKDYELHYANLTEYAETEKIKTLAKDANWFHIANRPNPVTSTYSQTDFFNNFVPILKWIAS
jgi:hypothetical protein